MTSLIESDSFPNAWGKIVYNIMNHGCDRPADDERAVIIRNTEMVVDLNASAIADIYKHKLHPLYPQKHGLDDYIAQFNPAAPQAFQSIVEQPYTYMFRTLKQVQYIRNNHLLRKQFNKRIRAITWNTFEDLGHVDVPCLQSLSFVNIGNNEVHMFTSWRSHDMYGAWAYNNIALVDYITRELLIPEELKLVHLTEFNESAHVYDYNWNDAKRVMPLAEVGLHFTE